MIARLRALIADIDPAPPAPLSSDEIERFEARYRVRLPDEYRAVLTELGIGPDLLPLGAHEAHEYFKQIVGDPSQPFPHQDSFQLLDRFLDEQALEGVEDASPEMDAIYDEATERMDDAIFDDDSLLRTDGLIPVADLGCNEWVALITAGVDRGCVWIGSGDGGLSFSPVALDYPQRSTFARWYESYLAAIAPARR